jgi:hypothetical protein
MTLPAHTPIRLTYVQPVTPDDLALLDIDASLVRFVGLMQSFAERILPGQTRLYYKVETHPDAKVLRMEYYGVLEHEAFQAQIAPYFHAAVGNPLAWLVRRPENPLRDTEAATGD